MKKKQILALFMALSMAASLAACGTTQSSEGVAEPAANEASADGVAEAPAGDASGNAASADASGNAKKAKSESTSGTFDTMVDEKGSEVAEGGNVVTSDYLSADGSQGQLGSWSGLVGFKYRADVVVKDGAVDGNSVYALAGINDGYDATGASGLEVNTISDGLSAFIVMDSDYAIADTTISMNTESDGKDVNDFAGYGAAVAVYGDSLVTIENTTIETNGVAKLATFVDNGADLVVKNSTFKTNGGDIYPEYKSTANQSLMINPPWVLGISGSVRTTNVMGDYTTGTYIDSTIESSNWGAVSSDSGTAMHITAINDDIIVDGQGYGAYSIGDDTMEEYLGSRFDVETYAIILTGANAKLASYTGGEEIEIVKLDDAGTKVATVKSDAVAEGTVVPTTVESDNFGFMFHANGNNNTSNLDIQEGTKIHTGATTFLIKKVNNNITVDGAEITADNGVILQMIDNDDDMIGAYMDDVFGMPTFNLSFTEPDGWSSTWGVEAKDSGWVDTFTVTNTALKGDIFNGTGYTSNGGATLNVTLGAGATLDGAIAATEIQHAFSEDELNKTFTYRDENGSYDAAQTAEAANKLGHVINQVYDNGVNVINVELTDDAVWTVTDDSCVATLTIGQNASVVYGTATVDGAEVELEAGKTYNNVVLTAK